MLYFQGPYSFYGVKGQEEVSCGKIIFKFSANNDSCNGTKVKSGQIPQILYSL